MVTLCDEKRFQQLPTQEEWEQIVKNIENQNARIIKINRTHWFNLLTRCKGPVTEMPILAAGDNSNRCWAIAEIVYKETLTPEEIKEITGEDIEDIDDEDYHDEEYNNPKTKLTERKRWIFNKDYCHQNISSGSDWYNLSIEKKELESGYTYTSKMYSFRYYSICSPITMHHFYTKDLKELTLIFKGQLMGQNGNSPYRTVESVANNYNDTALRDIRGGFIKRTAPILQLLSKLSINDLSSNDTARKTLMNLSLPKDESEVLAKYLDSNKYSLIPVSQLEKSLKNKELSCYYPIITYEQTKNILDDLPKIKIEFACYGLGSAGSGILAQVGRANWFQKFLLCDFDYVEDKNLRNQWYTTNHTTLPKVTTSETILKTLRRDTREVIIKNMKFEDSNMEAFQFKYVVAGFDSIDTRLNFLDVFLTGKSQAKYLIDTRYDDLTASIFFIDLENEAQVDYYKKGLLSDKEAFDTLREKNITRITNADEFIKYLDTEGIFYAGCAGMYRKLYDTYKKLTPLEERKEEDEALFDRNKLCSSRCKSTDCIQHFKNIYNAFPQMIHDNFFIEKKEESSCLKENFIDIYNFASSFVFSAIRQIENGEEKPFTHIEVQTENIPSSMVLRK